MTGNFPQAFSHIGLINAAWAIAQARERVAGRGQSQAPPSVVRWRGNPAARR
jgi:hypothetical protein